MMGLSDRLNPTCFHMSFKETFCCVADFKCHILLAVTTRNITDKLLSLQPKLTKQNILI